jgi:ribosomal protein S18 acetylase RimI-like enzyme
MSPPALPVELLLRSDVRTSDRESVRRLVATTGFFRPDEVDVAVELVDARLEKGDESGYYFVLAEQHGQVVGYACYGPIACTLGSFDLYWIAVDPEQQGKGLGRRLMEESERRILDAGGRHIYIETSGRPQYTPTRAFYERCGYELAAVLKDYYERGDDKWIWRKVCS